MDLAFITWTHTDCQDVFPLYFGQLDKYCNDYKSYVFINSQVKSIPSRHIQLVNNGDDLYYKRFISCLESVEEEHVIYMQEDYVLYSHPNHQLIKKYNEFLLQSDYSCLRLIKSGEMGGKKITETLHDVPMNSNFLFSHQASIWNKKDLLKLLKFYKPYSLPHVELYGSSACNTLNIKSCYHYQNEDRVGKYHFNSNVFPYVATAINKKKWNMSEY